MEQNSVSTARGLPPNGIPAKPMAPHAAWYYSVGVRLEC